ncbi:helix-turn-helix transcriptional regulator [Roseibium aggregatum]|uniref:Shikimate kinase n=1 Tax=Roseibium aggregatum TaxID=187304 RepID=A0A926NWG3_9HYPH|nr:helix-turn-helix transcriptional regulator [Roseibium aggregatum]MBD1548637.1 helix-turn-helix transcriptional regulator [Roseibium aggregatum]
MNEITNFRGEVVPDERLVSREGDVDAFVAAVGERVRKARERKGIARRVLSELSGVSQRYLAQLESGGGNISIALLFKVANALDHRVEWLVGEDDPWSSETARVAEFYRQATTEQRQRVMQILDPGRPAQLRRQRICLIGLRGAGKSTLGRLLGEELSVPFIELNRDIEEQSGMPVSELMALYGQEGYRRLERQAIERVVATSDSVVLAVGGGIVSEPETYGFLLRNFHTIWLKASPEEHMNRVRGQGDERPMAGNPKAMEELKSILTSREVLYAKAESIVNTSGKSVEDSLQDLTATIRDLGIF